MCGLAGSFGGPVAADRIGAAQAALDHRGPDAAGHAAVALGGGTVTLVHTRLSIIDLDPRSTQPMRKHGLTIAYNGEIYNYVELRRELEALGHGFATTSDTEVVLEAYCRWGAACTDRMEGMWAIALVDETAQTLWLSRDRFGEKPLYLWLRDGSLYFSSEVKGIAALAGAWPRADLQQIRRFLVTGYKSLYKRPATWFDGVRELPPATSAVLRAPGWPAPEPYWQPAFAPTPMSLDDAVEATRDKLEQALRIRLRADVPVAFCLSGGIDSGLLASLAVKRLNQHVLCYSIVDHDPRYDESTNIGAVVRDLGCEHRTLRPDASSFRDQLAGLVRLRDAPVVTINSYMQALLMRAIRADGCKVALTGVGADELFSGYYDHYGFWLASRAAHGAELTPLIEEWRDSYGRFVRNPFLQDPRAFIDRPDDRRHIYLDLALFDGFMTEPLGEGFAEERFCADALRNRMLNELRHESVPVMLREEDANAMASSVENRVPYLDRGLAEFAYQVPTEHLFHGGYGKYLLRAAGAGVFTDAVRLDKQKRGFNLAIEALVDLGDADTRDWLLADSPILDLVRRDRIADFLAGDMSDNSFKKFLFAFISSKTFLEQMAAKSGGGAHGG